MSNPFADKVPKIGIVPFPAEKAIMQMPVFAIEKPPRTKLEDIKSLLQGKILGRQIILGTVPSKSNCYRIVTIPCKPPKVPFSSLAKKTKLKNYEKAFALQCNLYRNAGIETDFKFEMDVYYPSRRADLDNSLKCVLDCLQVVGAIKNDNLCQEILVRRHVDKDNPRIEFVITPIPD